MKIRWQWMMALAICGFAGCDESADDLELDDEDQVLEAGPGPSVASEELTIIDHTDAYPGFPVGISVQGDDVVLDWSAAGSFENAAVWRSTSPTSLEGAIAPPNATRLVVLVGGATTYVDTGAASRTQGTPTYFYRVVSGAVFSTMVAKVTTAASPGYTKVGLCMLDMPGQASAMVQTLGTAAQSVHVWDPAAQGWTWWSASNPYGDLALPFGGAASINFSGEVSAYVSLTGRVPTNEPSQVTPAPGLNIPVHPLRAAPTTASALLGQPGVVGVGYWHPPTQQQRWYYGNPGDVDFNVTPCMPHYIVREGQ